MEKVAKVTGVAAPLMLANVDTDVIIRIERLTSLPKEKLGPYAFEALRYRQDGAEDPGFVLNRPPFRGAPILLAGANFGCGSSREGAVSALLAVGIRCVIAESFGDIFRNNCYENGLLPVELPRAGIDALAKNSGAGVTVEVDLAKQTVTSGDNAFFHFGIDPLRREALLKGLDSISQTLHHEASIADYQRRSETEWPWIWQPVAKKSLTEQTAQGDSK